MLETFASYVLQHNDQMDVDYLFSTFYNFMKHLKLYDVMIKDNNQLMKDSLGEENNPLLLSIDKIEDWYKNSSELSETEKMCFVMLYANRISKVAIKARNEFIEEKTKFGDRDEYEQSLEKIYKTLKSVLSKNLMDEFLILNEKFKNGEILKNDFYNNEIVRRVKRSISMQKETQQYIDAVDMYKYIVFRELEEKMYNIKHEGIKKVLANVKGTDIVIGGEPSQENDEKKSSVFINIPQYGGPFTFHFYRKFFENATEQYGINIGEQPKGLRFGTIWPIKLNDQQIQQVSSMNPETQTGKNIQTYVRRNKKRFRIINLKGKTTLKTTPEQHQESKKEPSKESKMSLKMQKEMEFAKHIAQISQINGIENYIEQLAHNSQPILLRTKYKKMEEYISKKLKEEHGITDQNIIEAETAKAFIYTKLVRGGMYTLEKNMPSIYQDYTLGCLLIAEAIANKAEDIKIYVKYSMNKRKKVNIT